MPYEWLPPAGDSPARLHLWPYRSLPRRGFVGFIAATCTLIALPMLTVIGSPVLWGLLPFFLLAVGGVWFALSKSYRDAEIVEELSLRRERLALVRHGPGGKRQEWEASPYWVRLTLHPRGGPVPNYLTLTGEGREVEIGAFLSEDERVTLQPELQRALDGLR